MDVCGVEGRRGLPVRGLKWKLSEIDEIRVESKAKKWGAQRWDRAGKR